MATKGLGVEDFDSVEDYMKAADVLIKEFQEANPEAVAKHPNKIYPDNQQLDQFWFALYKGNWFS